jgi:aspartyl-tRNA(Asn)/glutamyl-tRNA(Gln) amidotransferase subunit B
VKTYETIIGLEIHVQLKTASKMFCSSPNNPDITEPNVNICEVCTGQPGSLPVANKEAVRKAILVGLALGCRIPEHSKFDRKNYFYPDLPKGYQISQYDQPLCVGGEVIITSGGEARPIHITRAHLEEDAGKLIHEGGATLVDLNRAGVPLLEIVTEPDFRTAQEAKLFLQNLRNTVRYLGVSDADMEKGHLRCDANISLRPASEQNLPGYKVEIKNLNSFKAVEAALEYERIRQTEALTDGGKLVNETRGWEDAKGLTLAQRTKEEAQDYRYFPEPDLPVMRFEPKYIEELRAMLPELPGAKTVRFRNEYKLRDADIENLINWKELSEYFEEVISELKDLSNPTVDGMTYKLDSSMLYQQAVNWCSRDFTALLNESGLNPQESNVSPENLAQLIILIQTAKISSSAARAVFKEMFEKGGEPENIVHDLNLGQVSDKAPIVKAVDEVIAENPKAAEDFKSGKKQAGGFLVGKVMAKMQGKANPQMVNEILEEKLRAEKSSD